MKEKWMSAWGGFEKKHPKLAKWLYQIFYFFVFSMGVTIIQYLFFTFMPGILGERVAAAYVAPAVYNILVTFITGGVSMVIFFFVFKIIFPEGEAKKK